MQERNKMAYASCADCTENCVLLHQRNQTPKLTRFFKVMFGKDRDKFMDLPPDFAPFLETMAGESFTLEDADDDGLHQWPVLLSHVEGSLAFTNGWSSFFDDHGLEEGSFLVFEYTEGSKSLSVRVFEKSGCERTKVSADEAINENVNDKSSPENEVRESDLNEVVVEMASPIEEASTRGQRETYFFNVADKSLEDDDANRIPTPPEAVMELDFGSAEKEIDSDVGSIDELIELDEDCDLETPVDKPIEDALILDKASITEQEKSDGGVAVKTMKNPSKASDIDDAMENGGSSRRSSGSKRPIFFTGKSVDGGEPAKKVVKTEKSSGPKVIAPRIGTNSEPNAKGRETQMADKHIDDDCEGSSREISEKEVDGKRDKGGNFNKIPDHGPKSKKRSNGKRSAKMRDSTWIREALRFIGGPLGQRSRQKMPSTPEKVNSQVPSPVVKAEPHSPDYDRRNSTFSVVVKGRELLELPRGSRSYCRGGHVIYLEDPKGRVWPVICEPGKTFVALWGKFCSKNDICEGDICIFDLEDDAMFRVRVESKS